MLNVFLHCCSIFISEKCLETKLYDASLVDENTCRLEMMCLGLSNTVVSHRGTWSGCAKTKEESFLFLLPASFPLCYFVLALHPSPSSECRRECLLDLSGTMGKKSGIWKAFRASLSFRLITLWSLWTVAPERNGKTHHLKSILSISQRFFLRL